MLNELQNFLLLKIIDCILKRRAGILVLINDVDWELENEYDYIIKENDIIGFISTLHGG